MEKLIENIGVKGGFNKVDIWNQMDSINANINKLAEADLNTYTDKIILIAINYSLSLKLQMEYKNVINFAQSIII